jgi:D-ornithine 4,5-aminomutase subunit beta
MKKTVREIKERAILFLEELLEVGGYFEAVEQGFFIDSGIYPERNGDGISRKINGGIGAGTVYPRDRDYFAPVTAHFGHNSKLYEYFNSPSELIGGCTLEDRKKIIYIDELDENDNVNKRLQEKEEFLDSSIIKPEVEWLGDGIIVLDMTLPTSVRYAEAAAIKIAEKMNLEDPEVIHKELLHPAEATRIQVKARVNFSVDLSEIKLPPVQIVLSDEEIKDFIKKHPLKIVAGTIGEDEHSVGLREIIDIKHGGIEKYGIECTYLGTSVPVNKIVDAAVEIEADAILISTIISHDEIHYKNMKKVHDYAVERGIREKVLIIAGGTQVVPELAFATGVDIGFGRGTKGSEVASFLVRRKKEILKQ